MLLRLVPAPTPRTPQPPTILFSLHLPHQPYTAKGLPLPASLLAHQAACHIHGLPCPNPLLGDKASWLAGVVHQVSFYPAQGTIRIQLILSDSDRDGDGDGVECEMPLGRSCREMCEAVMEHVTQSFAPPPPPELPASPTTASLISPPLSPPMTPRPSCSSSSFPANDSKRHSPSSLLMSLLSPLLPSSSSEPTRADCPTTTATGFSSQQRAALYHQGKPTTPLAHQRSADPQRYHRRQARSLLVDTFTRFVLPGLKRRLRDMCYPDDDDHDAAGAASTIASSSSTTTTTAGGYLPLALALQIQKKRRQWHAAREEVEQLLLVAANTTAAAAAASTRDGNTAQRVVEDALRIPSLGGSLGPRKASAHANMLDWDALEISKGSSTEAQAASSSTAASACSTAAYETASQRTAYYSSLPPYTSLPSRLAQRYAAALKRLEECTAALAALERYAFSDLRGEEVRRASWEREEARRVEQRAVRRAAGEAVWSSRKRQGGMHEIGVAEGIPSEGVRQSRLRNCVYSAAAAAAAAADAAAREHVGDDDEFAPGIHVRPISPSCSLLERDDPGSSCFADAHAGGHRSESQDDDDQGTSRVSRHPAASDRDRLQSSLVTAFQDFCDSATNPAPALVYTHSAESFDSASSSSTDDTSCGDTSVECISPIEDAAPPIEDALFLFPPKYTVASTYQLAPPRAAAAAPAASPSPLLEPIDLHPPAPCTALPPAVEILHHNHHAGDEGDGDPVGIRREEIWVEVLSGRRKSGSAAAAAAVTPVAPVPAAMEVAPAGRGGFFGWLQQQQTHFPPAAPAAAAC